MKQLSKVYHPQEVEGEIYKLWEKSGFFNPDRLPGPRKKNFVVMMPPPNITGSLHLGHALEATATDCLIRFKRMMGFRTLWLPGLDHASIATQYVVEKELKKEGLTRQSLGKKKFLKRVWEWKEKYGSIILDQLKRLGVSADWSRTVFTMDPQYIKAVEAAFNHYRKKGWIYKGEKVVNWCPRCQTSLSDLELEYKEEKGKLWYIRYPLVKNSKFKIQNSKFNYIVVATARPETMLGDTAVAVNPKDKRWKGLVGKKAILPLVGREIPIIADPSVEKDFGTGAVKITPAHDLADAEIAARHKLSFIKVIDENAKMTKAVPEKYQGLSIQETREAVVQDLKAQGFLESQEDYTHNVAFCYRCSTLIEPLPSPQWFLKMEALAKEARQAYESGRVKIYPERFKKVALDWLSQVKDWPISRQLWWGQKIPIKGEEDIFDTWFSSALWPFATLGWPEKTSDFKKYYPGQWISAAREILHLWITRMVFSGIELAEEVPFSEVWIHPTVLTSTGRRMSKSLGTGVDPLELIDRYGADATRFGLLWHITGLQDIRFDETAMVSGKKFCNKIWNAARFVLQYSKPELLPETPPSAKSAEDQNVLGELMRTRQVVQDHIAELRFGQALEAIYAFFWHTFCDKYIEYLKTRKDKPAKKMAIFVLAASLKLLHPFLPFITEKLWQKLPQKKKALLMVKQWL